MKVIAGETVFDLIQYAGGLTPDAADKIGLSRIKAHGRKRALKACLRRTLYQILKTQN